MPMARRFSSCIFKSERPLDQPPCSFFSQLEAARAWSDDHAAQKAADSIGRAVALTNVLRGTSYHASKGVLYFPRQLMEHYQVQYRVPSFRISTW